MGIIGYNSGRSILYKVRTSGVSIFWWFLAWFPEALEFRPIAQYHFRASWTWHERLVSEAPTATSVLYPGKNKIWTAGH